ncbi:unnamed protein product, partial [marine sediment metagenome]
MSEKDRVIILSIPPIHSRSADRIVEVLSEIFTHKIAVINMPLEAVS